MAGRTPRQRVRQRRQRRAPWLASDTIRGFVSLVGVLLAMPATALLPELGLPPPDPAFIAATLFAAWVLYCLVYAVLTVAVYLPPDAERFADMIAATTPRPGWRTWVWVVNGGGAVSWALTGSFFAVSAVVFLVSQRELLAEPLMVGLTIGVVVASWALMMLAYAVRYAREWVRTGGLVFGGDEVPSFAEFLYLAVQVATTFSTSDVTVTTRRMRSIVAVNSVVAFAFNTVIVALLVSTLISAVT
jgi:uncharacterized membrane protein